MSRKEVKPQKEPAKDKPQSVGKAPWLDNWDQPEFDESADSRKREYDGPSERIPTKKSKTESNSTEWDKDALIPVANISSDVKEEAQVSATTVDPPGESTKRRSFCNFHYRTTQGGSTHIEPGVDATMQSPGTESGKALKLLEFARDDQDSKIKVPDMK